MISLKQIYDGRTGRVNFILGTLFFFMCFAVLLYLLSLIASMLGRVFGTGSISLFFSVLIVILYLVMIVIYLLPLWVRRLHDLGKSGWYMVIYVLVAVIRPLSNSEKLTSNIFFDLMGLIVCLAYLAMFIVLVFIKGNIGTNKYGEKPSKGFNRFFKEIFNEKGDK